MIEGEVPEGWEGKAYLFRIVANKTTGIDVDKVWCHVVRSDCGSAPAPIHVVAGAQNVDWRLIACFLAFPPACVAQPYVLSCLSVVKPAGSRVLT